MTKDWNKTPKVTAKPDFGNLLAVLKRGKPKRPTLFEFFLNIPLYARLSGETIEGMPTGLSEYYPFIHAFKNAGYDYSTFIVPGFEFSADEVEKKASYSINEGAVITDRASFESYNWQDPNAADYNILKRIAPEIPKGMKLVVAGPCGVLENVIRLVGYDNLCFMLVDDHQLTYDIFENVGSRLVKYYTNTVKYNSVGAIISNDDWGFKSQTLLSPDDMRRYIFPWHKEIVEVAHAAGKPAILHSCGCLFSVMDDIIDDMKYDGKHSYEDIIQPVEEAYEEFSERIAIMGGIDVDFVCRHSPEEVYTRSKKMLEKAEAKGGYALGTGNSVPEFLPDENYFAMIRAAIETRIL